MRVGSLSSTASTSGFPDVESVLAFYIVTEVPLSHIALVVIV